MLYLDHLSDAPIKIILNSPGGHVESGDTIHDLISYVRSPVAVIGTGWVLTACISAVLWEDSEATAEPVPGAEPG